MESGERAAATAARSERTVRGGGGGGEPELGFCERASERGRRGHRRCEEQEREREGGRVGLGWGWGWELWCVFLGRAFLAAVFR